MYLYISYLWLFEWELSLIGSGIWTLGSQMEALSWWEVYEAWSFLGGNMPLEVDFEPLKPHTTFSVSFCFTLAIEIWALRYPVLPPCLPPAAMPPHHNGLLPFRSSQATSSISHFLIMLFYHSNKINYDNISY